MELLYTIIERYAVEVILVILGFICLAIILIFINMGRTSRIIKKYNLMMQGMNNKSLETMLLNQINIIEKTANKVKNLDREFGKISAKLDGCIQNMAIIRYNPFEQMGGDQSFSISLVDGKGNGAVISGLYSREASTVFAKPLDNYQSQYHLSNEEMQVIRLAKEKSRV